MRGRVCGPPGRLPPDHPRRQHTQPRHRNTPLDIHRQTLISETTDLGRRAIGDPSANLV